ncbi:MAG: hypothetical protein KC708_08505 [Anaerolineae bacterium]|nr:hypothetical protein [Anaerolineae bacterium]
MLIFGILAFVFGLVGLLSPETVLSVTSMEVLPHTERVPGDYTLTFITAASMASVNMGVYYVLASLNNMKTFYRWTVPFRVLTFTVFTLAVVKGIAPSGFLGVGIWELVGAIATGLALWSEAKKAAEPK